MTKRIYAAILVLLVLAVGAFAADTLAAYFRSSSMLPSEILQRSLSTMAAIHELHGSGRNSEREVEVSDLDSRGSWRIQGDCVTRGAETFSRFSIQGKQTGRHAHSVDEQYTVRSTPYEANPVLWWRAWTVWTRTAHPPGRWHRAGVTHDARIASSMCPSLIVPRLRLQLPGPVKNLGRVQIGARSAVHLQSSVNGEGGGATVDLYIDPVSFRWMRVGLSGWGAGCCHSYSSTFDYSRYNVPTSVTLPPHGSGATSAR
jgi:hypothetical protein